MFTINDVHQQFAEYFDIPVLKPYAYLLSKKISEGHICLHLDDLQGQSEELPAYCANMVPGTAPLETVALVAKDGKDDQPFVLFQDRLYLQRYFRYETTFLRRIYQFLETEKVLEEERLAQLEEHADLIKAQFPSASNTAPDWQLAAAITGVLNNFTIITGGPGTGKTTTVAKILNILYGIDPALKVVLAAPTGKAAARLAESLRNFKNEKFQSLSPGTIHRLLKSKRDSPYFHHNASNPLNYDVVIVDECSMIDVALFAKLLDAIGPKTRLILLGDKDQLASVEAGSFFGDLCQAQGAINLFRPQRIQVMNKFGANLTQLHESANDKHPLFQHLVELRTSHRFSDDKGIGKFSKAIIRNEKAAILEFLQENADEQVVIDQVYSKELFEQFIAGYEAFIKEPDTLNALKKMNALRVLCAVRQGEQGLYTVNKAIEKYLHDKKLIRANVEFYENRPIILTRNYYEHNLFNGDTGVIRPDANGILMAWFEDGQGELKAVLPGYLTDAETVFAMTIHKSQGSEFNEVLVVLPQTTEVAILTRELLYTAITRARSKVYVQASEAVLLLAAQRFVERASGIATRFIES
ncbi:exodeoxyribonuclease V subunit alpha [Chitinophaga niabensis]|uniref:exodeoxyribonuclease V subunit alpha n=1 Tax=Chitinophaga niabensis TaxID=536979 RepID=UPI0031BB9DB6